MNLSVRAAAAMLLAFAAVASVAKAQTAAPPVEVFANLPALAGAVLSPDGKHMAVLQAQDGKPIARIYAVGAPAGTQPATCGSPDGVIAGVEWANDNRLLIFVTVNTRNSVFLGLASFVRAISVDANCANGVVLLRDTPYIQYNPDGASILDRDPADPNFVFMQAAGYTDGAVDNGFYLNIYRVDLTTGKGKVWDNGNGTVNTASWMMDGHGNIAARTDIYRKDMRMHIKVPNGTDYREVAVFSTGAASNGDVEGLLPDGRLAVRTRGPEGTEGLYPLDIQTGKLGAPLFANPTYDLDAVTGDEWTGRLTGVSFIDDSRRFTYFDPALAKLQKTLEGTFPRRTVIVSSTDRAHDAYIVETEAPDSPPVYYYFQPATMHAAIIGTAYPGLVGVTLAQTKPYSYKARDGLTIHGYVTFPPGRDPRKLPAVVFPHGGPIARDSLDFDWWAQFMANRGYAVFQPNFRGSSGYGQNFMTAGFRQWGLKMQDDVTDGVKQLIADGTIDPKRVCIVGASYGGYVALAGAAFTPDLYACTVSFAGLGNLQRLVDNIEHDYGSESSTFSYEQDRIGDPSRDGAQLKATSPALHADQIKIPVLLIHGMNDLTVPIQQSEEMNAALEDAKKKDVQFIRISGEDHYMKFGSTRLQLLTEIEKFLKANIGQ